MWNELFNLTLLATPMPAQTPGQGTFSREAQCEAGGAQGPEGTQLGRDQSPKGSESCRCPLSSHVPLPSCGHCCLPVLQSSESREKTRCEQLVKHLERPSAKAGRHCPTRAGHTGGAQAA